MLELKNISKKLGSFELHDISLYVNKGEYFVILGKSGAGKTVLLEIITGLLAPDKGKIYLDNEDITKRKIQKRNIGLVFQNHSLFPHLSVKENILYPLKAQKQYKKEYNKKLLQLTELLGINHLLKCKPTTLSLGESQRVALARTLIIAPKCILLDEPLSSLDIQTKSEIKSLLRNINNKNTKQTIIHVTHDYEEAISLADRVAVIENNTISQIGTPEEVFRYPKTEFTANFIGIKNFFKGNIHEENSSKIFVPDNSKNLKIYVNSSLSTKYGSIIIRSEDITISNIKTQTSARNSFDSIISDIEKVRNGIEITVKINDIKLSALITATSLYNLDLQVNKRIYLSFKASAVKFIEG